MYNRIKTFAEKLTGNVAEFTMEARIFHAACIVSMAAIACNIPLNYIIGIPLLSILMSILLLLIAFIYYYSRYRGKLNMSFFLYCLFGNVFFAINYSQNSGINGPSLLIFLLSLFLVIAVAPKIQFWFWIPLNIILVGLLLVMEFRNPRMITNTYPAAIDRFIDFGYSYLLIALLIASITLYIRNNYNKQRLALMKKAAELERTNETKNKLFSVVAHDLRAPLVSIQNYLELLTEYKLSEEEKQGMEHDLLEKTKNTSQMLSNLLSWTMNQMEGVTVKLEELHLNEILKTVITIQSTIAGEKCIDLKNELSGDAYVIADANMLQLVVRNLLNNAIKFTPPGGEITLTSELLGANWYILIRDTGVGIADERKADIFSLKNQSTYGTKNEKGTGLGLLLCKEFTELQHGKIWFDSRNGAGTTFYISLEGCRLREHVKKPIDVRTL
jgi:two-component system sensor histidine kinase/response regulator